MLDPSILSEWNVASLTSALAYALSPGLCGWFLHHLIGYGKKILDFSVTRASIHVILCTVTSHFPTNIMWWLINLSVNFSSLLPLIFHLTDCLSSRHLTLSSALLSKPCSPNICAVVKNLSFPSPCLKLSCWSNELRPLNPRECISVCEEDGRAE